MPTKSNGFDNKNDLVVDVVIIGAGGAGLAAAIEAAGAGANTLVLEKADTLLESSTAISAGTIGFAGTEIQAMEGIHDSNKLLFKDIMDVGLWKSDERLVRAYVENQLDTFHWLSGLGLKWGHISAAAGMSVPRGHFVDPVDCVAKLHRTAKDKGAKIFLDAPATGLLTDDQNRVTGCRFVKNNEPATVWARRGVVLTTGGFGHDLKRLGSIDPRFREVAVTTSRGHTGEGLRWAESLGAKLLDMNYVKPSFELHVTGSSSKEILLIFYLGAIIINQKGSRFVNESISYKEIGIVCLEQPNALGYQVFDQNVYDLGVKNARKAGALIPVENFTLGLDDGRIKLLDSGSSLDELAKKIGVPKEKLNKTIADYNEGVKKGKDLEFGRNALSGNVGNLVKIEKPPFYAYKTKSHFLATYAGVAVDDAMRVQTLEGGIPGLYAAGEIIGGFHGASYHTGTALGKAFIFGRIAGKNASQGR